MTEKQKIFADEYLIDLNATRAYRVAYLSAICKYKKDGKKLSAKSLMLIVNTAIELVTGEDEGEQ